MKGRKAMPSNLHVLQGTHRSDRHTGGAAVMTIVNPDPPDDMPEVAAAEWKRIAPILSKYKLLSDLDLTALEAYCRVYARWLHAEKKLDEKDSYVFRTQTGYETQSAYLNIINMCLKQMQSFMAEFGMTPATRERLKAIASQPKQIGMFDDFLSRKGNAGNTSNTGTGSVANG
ncbi:MAG: phage terminase small subunit P27 family [Limnohabitans sp.]